MKKVYILLSVLVVMASVSHGAVGDSWNLSDDWSTTVVNDPNGWTYHQVEGTPFTTFGAWGGPDFPLGEMGWSMSPGNHLGMSKLVHDSSEDTAHTYSYVAGEICGHTNSDWGATWTVPPTEGPSGRYLITGSVHEIRGAFGSVVAILKAGGSVLFSYELQEDEVAGSGKNVDYPYTFSEEVILVPGETVDLTMSTAAGGDFGCIGDLNIERLAADIATLTINADPAYVDTVDPAIGAHFVQLGQTVDLVADTYIDCEVNNEILIFDSWTGDVADSGSATTTILMDANKTVTANYVYSSECGGIGSVWNLSDGWREIEDSNSVWTYHEVEGTPFTTFGAWGGADFPLGETGWSMSPGNHLGMSKLVHDSSEDTAHTYSYVAGEICGHTNSNWGATWAVPPIAGDGGRYRITGSVHEIRSGMGSVVATLTAGGSELFSYELQEGSVAGSGKDVDYPYTFSHEVMLDASDANDVVDLTMSANGNGDFGCIGDLSIERITNVDVTLTINADPAYVDTVDPVVGAHIVTEGTIVNLVADAYIDCDNSGEVLAFDSWTGDVADPGLATTTIVMDTNKTVTANYVDNRTCGDDCHPYPQYDFSQNCIVDLADLSLFAAQWLNCTQPVCD